MFAFERSRKICMSAFEESHAVLHSSQMGTDVPAIIRALMESLQVDQTGLAKALGGDIGQSHVSRWASGTKPSKDHYDRILALSQARDIRTDQPRVNQPKAKGRAKPPFGLASDLASPETSNVPELEVRAGAGYGGGFSQEEATIDENGNSVSQDVIRFRWGLPTPFLREELRIRPGRASILPIRGDSMRDALFDGDRAIVNLDDTDVSQGGIFALVDDDGALIIKQVEIVRGKGPKRIRCTSRNPAYKPFELVLNDPVRIVGRVASKITRI